ncbi:hypothetical protein KY315_04550 [Candidatus Woesearchaeota archaeon]|nr:hypothetical protein [Candidatus Woesearchaeota archaeon]
MKDLAKKIIFVLIFFALVLIGKNINFSAVVGADSQFFTLFQFFGPIAGGFLGSFFGIIAVFFAQLADLLIVGKEFQLLTLLRFLPMLLAVYYFGSKKKSLKLIVPLLCIILFVLNPVGRQAWFYSMFWLIPILAVILPKKVPGKLFFRSFGATFTAHAVGSVIWLYSVPMTAQQWISLIPITAYERFLFGIGIAVSFVVLNTVLDFVVEKLKLSQKVLFVDKRYTLSKLLKFKSA